MQELLGPPGVGRPSKRPAALWNACGRSPHPAAQA